MSNQATPAPSWPESVPATVMGTGATVSVPGRWMYDAPAWARSYKVQIDTSGQPWLTSHADGAAVFTLPDGWVGRRINLSSSTGAVMNYGVDMGQLKHQPAGSLQTNDPSLRLTGQCQPDDPVPLPSSSPSPLTDLILPLAILAAVVLVLFKLRQKGA